MKEELQSNLQRDFAIASLRAGVRVDGRPLDVARNAQVVLGPAFGQAHVSLGRTVALATAKAEPVTPYPDRPAEGTLSVSVELSAASSEPAALEFAVHGSNPPADRASMALRGIVERVIRDARAIDTEALCILAGKKVWAVSVSVSVIDAAGNSADAAHLAAMGALLHARRNDVSISGTDVHIHPFSEREPLPLPIHHVPLTVTYALFSGTQDFPDDIAALDPSLAEELASDGSVTISLNAHGEVCGLYKAGGLPVMPELVVRCADVAKNRVVALTDLLNKALHESSVKHHPLAPVRPVLVAPEPSAVIPRKPAAGEGSGDSEAKGAESDVQMKDTDVGASLSAWNAKPIEEEPPPSVPVQTTVLAVRQAKDTQEDDFVQDVFRSVEQQHRGGPSPVQRDTRSEGQGSTNGVSASRAAQKGTPGTKPKKHQPLDSDDSESSVDSDEDMMAAVIAKPRGGGARSKSRVKE